MESKFPTKFHEKVFISAVDFLKGEKDILALTLAGSSARGEGTYDSDIDLNFFTEDQVAGKDILKRFEKFRSGIGHSEEVGRYFDIDLVKASANIKPCKRGWTDGPDNFEPDIGNFFIYSELIFEKDKYFTRAKKKYIPYYDESLRSKRLTETVKFCENNIGHIEPYIERGLYFQAFKRLYDASREFLQALFISRKIYPIAYDKWIKKQIVEILDISDLYPEFVSLYEIARLESDELVHKGKKLQGLLDKYVKV